MKLTGLDMPADIATTLHLNTKPLNEKLEGSSLLYQRSPPQIFLLDVEVQCLAA